VYKNLGDEKTSMRADKSTRLSAFTLIEMLTIIAIIGLLAGLLLPALNSAREKGRRVACASNLRQIGIAIQAFASDNDNHTPVAYTVTAGGGTIPWYTALTNGGYTTLKVFQCPDDRQPRTSGDHPRSYAIVVGQGNTTSSGSGGNFWIAGSRLTCPYLTNTATAIVGEFYGDQINPAPTIEDNGTISPYITSSSDPYAQGSTIPPSSKHANDPSHLKGNYLFLDGHVEWVDKLTGLNTDQLALGMFPPVPANAPIPCP
jgi:prepilin-type processing-associated H-X9-DG protein